MKKPEVKKGYEAPTLTVYGSVAEITGNQNSSGNDVPCGPTCPGDNYYSVGK